MPPETDNLRLEELYAGDQKDRESVLSTQQQVEQLRQRDLARRKEVFEMITGGNVNTVNDLYRAAVIMLHGAEPKEFLCAHRLAVMASVNGHKPARWLAAASLDRFLMSIGRPTAPSSSTTPRPAATSCACPSTTPPSSISRSASSTCRPSSNAWRS
jgi:hypothetical protein